MKEGDKTLNDNLIKTTYACDVMNCLEKEMKLRGVEKKRVSTSLFTRETIDEYTTEVETSEQEPDF